LPVGTVIGAAAEHDFLDALALLHPDAARLDGDLVRRGRPRERANGERAARIRRLLGHVAERLEQRKEERLGRVGRVVAQHSDILLDGEPREQVEDRRARARR